MIKHFLFAASLLALGACGGEETAAPVEEASATSAIADAPTPEAETKEVAWAIATANDHATRAGAEILAQGGSAIDAAVAVQAVLGLVEPQSSGLGGGAFMMYYDATSGTVSTYDGREVAPYSASPEMFLGNDGEAMPFYEAVLSGRAVGVPGAVAMLDLAHSEHGKLEWAGLFSAAERLAREGFEVSPRLAGLLGRFARLGQDDQARAIFYGEDGTPLQAGATLINLPYAQTVEQIANGGAAAFYTGEIAEEIVNAVNARTGEGTMDMSDLAEYEPQKLEPVCAPFRAYEICSMAPPSSGGVTVVQILGQLNAIGLPDTLSPEVWPLYLESSRLAYADRELYLGDIIAMGQGDVSPDELIRGLIAPDYLNLRAGLIGASAAEVVEAGDPTTVPLKEGRAPDASPNLPGTSHFSIRDTDGNIVSMTTTVEMAFGSHLVAAGMILNNQLTDFSFLPERDGVPVVNAPAPGKKPRSSMSPVIVMDDEGAPVMAIGSPGGPAIIGYVAKTLLLTLGYDVELQAAIDHPNITVPRGSVLVETGTDQAIKDALTAYGLDYQERDLTSGLYGFRITPSGLQSGIDARREGSYSSGE